MDVDSLRLDHLPNSVYLQYLEDLLHIFDTHNPGGADIQSLMADLRSARDDIEAIFGLRRSSALTKEIHRLDELRGKYLVGLAALIRGNRKHFEADKALAADRLYTCLSVYGTPSSINKESLPGQSTTLTHLTEELQGAPTLSAAVAALGLAPWVAELKRVNDELRTAYWQRTAEVGDLPTAKIVDLRLTSNALYYQLRDKLLAYALLAGYAPPYDAVINKINALIAQYNVTLARGSAPGDVD